MRMTETKITYGHKKAEIEGEFFTVGFAEYEDENGDMIELLSVPYGGLYVKKNGELFLRPGEKSITPYVWIWTKVAGWLGGQDLAKKHFGGDAS